MAKALKLTIEMVPSTSWYTNMRSIVSQETWDRLRRRVYARYGHRCGICKARGKLNCHEIWEYDDTNYRQTLAGFIALCDLCHHVKHIGLAQLMADQGKLDYEQVIRHFMRVNKCDRATFLQHRREAFELWRRRSQEQWSIDIGGSAVD